MRQQVLAILLLAEKALFTWAFLSLVSLFKGLQEFKVVYQQRQLEKVIFDYTRIIVGSWKWRFKIIEFKYLWNQEGCSSYPKIW